MEGEVEGGEGGVGADGVEEEGYGGALALGGGLGQVFDDRLKDQEVPGEYGGVGLGYRGCCPGWGWAKRDWRCLGLKRWE